MKKNKTRKMSTEKVKSFYKKSKGTIQENLWLEVLFMVSLALLVSGMVFLVVSHFLYSVGLGREIYINYDDSRAYIQEEILNRVAWINEISDRESETDIEKNIKQVIEQEFSSNFVNSSQTYLVDSTGKIMYQNGIIESLNLAKVIKKANANEYSDEHNKFVGIYPVIIKDEVCYLYNESTLEPFSYREFTNIGNIIAFITSAAMFILIIFRLTRDKIAYVEYLSACLNEISKGNLDYNIEVVGTDELARVADSITHMENELKYQIATQIKTEKSKNELVTNVAHDLRTPLTSIIGYIGLVKSRRENDSEMNKYLEIAYNKAEKLKMIIEDLFELTKLHQGSVILKKTEVSIGNLLNQLIEELMPLANEKNIQIEAYITSKNTNIYVDAAKITRVFENLIENAIKYSPENESIYVELKETQNNLYIAVSNPSPKIPQEEIDKFFERFYRADQSRNSAGGSGLGLAIAKNIVELHGGSIEAKYIVDLLCFKIILPKK